MTDPRDEGRPEEPPDLAAVIREANLLWLTDTDAGEGSHAFARYIADAVLAALAGWAVDESGVPRKLEPADDGPALSIDPRWQGGSCCVAGRRVPTSALAAHAPIADTMDDYGVTRREVLVACWYEWQWGDRRTQRGLWSWVAFPFLAHGDYEGCPDPDTPLAELRRLVGGKPE